MPWNRKLYPDNWEQIALQIKEKADWTCQSCGKECRRSGESVTAFILRWCDGNLRDTNWSEIADHPQKWTLTVAHLNHEPSDCRSENLRALCAPCHCRMDLKAMGTKRRLKAQQQGQLSLGMGSWAR